MQSIKAVISFLLLFVYTIGLTHHLIPHYHGGNTPEAAEHHQINHHYNDLHQDPGHSHFAHEGHLDHGLINFIACLFGELEHPASDSWHQNYLLAKLNNGSFQSLAKAICVVIYNGASSEPDREKLYAGYSDIIAYYYLDLPLESSPLRGPPSLS